MGQLYDPDIEEQAAAAAAAPKTPATASEEAEEAEAGPSSRMARGGTAQPSGPAEADSDSGARFVHCPEEGPEDSSGPTASQAEEDEEEDELDRVRSSLLLSRVPDDMPCREQASSLDTGGRVWGTN